MMKIFKYPLSLSGEQIITAPDEWRPLSVQAQHGWITIWAMVNSSKPERQYKIRIFGTGHEIPDAYAMSYLGTVQDHTGLVWHVFQDTRH
jgi:hypothetical protein